MLVFKFVDTINEWTGKLVAWLILPLTGALVYEVISRYIFGRPTIWAFDLSYMLYGTHFMIGAAYVLRLGEHIRMMDLFDGLFRQRGERGRAVLDLCFYLLYFFPVMAVLLVGGTEFAWHSWTIRERSALSPWMPPIYPFKTVLPVAILLLAAQGVAQVARSLLILMNRRPL